jgi:regulator of sigma E protease
VEPRADGFAAVAAFLADVAFATRAENGPPTVYPRGGDFPDRRSPAADAGVLPGDVLLAIDGKPVSTVDDVMQRGASFDGSPVRLTVRTGDAAPRDVSLSPRTIADMKEREAFAALDFPKEEVDVGGIGGAAAAAWDRTTQEIGNIFRLIGRFFGGGVSFQKNISGPLTIGKLSSQSASGGLATFLAFLAFISVNLCVLNFLPIPVLDGGQMVFLLVEKFRGGRPLREATIAKFQLVGFLLLLLLMGFALKNDFKNLFGN